MIIWYIVIQWWNCMGLDGCWMILSGLSADTWVCSKLLMPNLSQLLGVHVFMYDQGNFLVASLVSHLRSPYLVQSRYIILYYDIQLILKSCCALENNHPKDGGTWNWEQSSGNERLSIISHKIKTLYAQTTYYRIPIIPPHLISFSEIQLFGRVNYKKKHIRIYSLNPPSIRLKTPIFFHGELSPGPPTG